MPGKNGTWCHVTPASGSLGPGGGQNVTVYVDAPSNVGSFSDCGIRISDSNSTNNPQDVSITYTVTAPVAGNNAACQSMVINGGNTTLLTGAVVPFTVTMLNNGGQTWNGYNSNPSSWMYLGINPWNPAGNGVGSSGDAADFGNMIYILLPNGQQAVAPGQSATFDGANASGQVKAPSNPGTYTFSWQMGHQGGPDWTFGAACSQQVSVTAAPTITAVSVTPSSGSSVPGTSQIFTQVYSDTAGAGDISEFWTFFRPSFASNPTDHACYVHWTKSGNQVYLTTDSASQPNPFQGPLTMGQPGTLSNSQCTLDVGGSSVVASGNNLTVTLKESFTPSFIGLQQNWLDADNGVNGSGWHQLGTWNVTPNDVGCSGGNCGGSGAGSPVVSSQASCPTNGVVLNWQAATGATSYNIYRNTHGGSPIMLASNVGNILTYTDLTASSGTAYDYWVEATNNGESSPTKVGASTNSSGGISANVCGGSGPATVSIDNSVCGQITVNWSSVGGATSYNIYRNTTGSGPAPGDLIKSGQAASPYVDSASSNLYYYWVSAIVGGVETSKVAPNSGPRNPIQLNSCTAVSMGDSDKDITAINGTNVSPAPSACNGHTDTLPTGTVLRLGDKLTFRVNLCTDQSSASSTGVSVADTLTNLQKPASGWNAYYCHGGTCTAWSPSLSGSILTFSGLGTIPPGQVGYYLIFDAQLSVPGGTNGSSSRFNNAFNISYGGGNWSGQTPWLPFYIGSGVPTIIEVP